MDRRVLEELLPALQSEDAFERLEAEARLRGAVRRDFGYRWDAPAGDRSAALDRLRAWLDEQSRARRQARKIAAGAAALELAKLQGLSPEEAQEKLQALLSKSQGLEGLAFGLKPCLQCEERPATVEVVDLRPGKPPATLHLCERCLARLPQ